MPIGKSPEIGMPFSLIFVGRPWSEAELLAYADAYEQATGHRVIPELVVPEGTAIEQNREQPGSPLKATTPP
jgi:hypothetical protein